MEWPDCEGRTVAALNVGFYAVFIPLFRWGPSSGHRGCLHATGVRTSFTIDYL